MVRQQFEVEVARLPLLTPEDLRGWDSEAVKLVLEYQLHGWTGFLSKKKHAIMRAPDGDGTASISRHWQHKRNDHIQRQKLDQWLERRKRAKAEAEGINAFGLAEKDLAPGTNHEVSDGKPPWIVAKKQSYDALLRLQKRTRDWWEDALLAPHGDIVYMFLEDGPDDWALMAGSRTNLDINMIAIGPAAQPADIEQIMIDMERLNERNRQTHEERSNPSKENESMTDTGPQTKKKYPCEEPGCDRSFDRPGALALHEESHVPGGFPCLLCDRVLRSSSARGTHLRGKEHEGDPRLPQALKTLSKANANKATAGGRYKRMPPRPCEYCDVVMEAASIGGHQRGHKKLGHIKIADGGDGATQVIGKAKAITTRKTTTETPKAVTEAPVKPEPLVVEAVPAEPVPVATNGKVHEPAEVYVPAALNGTGTGEPPEILLDRVRALVSPKMVGDLERARVRIKELETELAEMTADRDELQAMFDMIEERRKRVSASA